MKQRFLLYSMLIFSGMFAQTPDTKFGQSRVQYKDFNFSYYPSDHFVTYFYQGGQDVGKYVVNAAEEYYDELAQQLDVKVKAKTDIIVYNTLEDLNQTNIGIQPFQVQYFIDQAFHILNAGIQTIDQHFLLAAQVANMFYQAGIPFHKFQGRA